MTVGQVILLLAFGFLCFYLGFKEGWHAASGGKW